MSETYFDNLGVIEMKETEMSETKIDKDTGKPLAGVVQTLQQILDRYTHIIQFTAQYDHLDHTVEIRVVAGRK
jgi:hypothetical protein